MESTKHAYWQDAYQVRFDARVLERLHHDGQPAVVLDATCFYPTSGGQPHDTGVLGDARVVDVVEVGERIVHVLDGEVAGDTVTGEIDWERRFDHMQQHTGQHILSAAFHRLLEAPTVSFHLGEETCTIDIERSNLTPEEVALAEAAANGVIYGDRPIQVQQYDEDALDSVPLRRAPKVHGRIRVVSVEDWDASACGGTHVRSTGEIGQIHIRRWQKHRGVTRVEFLCGWRALRAMRDMNATLQQASSLLSVATDELPDSVARLIDAERDARRERDSLSKDLLTYRAVELAADANPWGDVRVLARVLEGCDAAGMRFLAQRMVQQPGMIVFLAVAQPAPQVVFARSRDVDGHMGALLKDVLGAHGGRGGGSPHMAQGGGIEAAVLGDIVEEARARTCAG